MRACEKILKPSYSPKKEQPEIPVQNDTASPSSSMIKEHLDRRVIDPNFGLDGVGSLVTARMQSNVRRHRHFTNRQTDWLAGWLAGWLRCLEYCLVCSCV